MTDIAIDCKSLRALDTLVAVCNATSHGYVNYMYSHYVDDINGLLLRPHVQAALAQGDLTGAPNIVRMLLRSTGWAASVPAERSRYRTSASYVFTFRSFVRKALHAQDVHSCNYGHLLQTLSIRDIGRWNMIPDDIMLLVLRLGNVKRCHPILQETDEAAMARRSLTKRFSRALLKLVDLIGDIDEVNMLISTCRHICELPRAVDITTAEAVIHILFLKYTGNSVTLQSIYEFERQLAIRTTLRVNCLRSYSEVYTLFWGSSPQVRPSKRAIFHAARCYRTCNWNIRRALRMYKDLSHIPDNYDLSLNFPSGYTKSYKSLITKPYIIKRFIVQAIYRWNYRLRRQRNQPFSEADIAYATDVGLPIPKEAPNPSTTLEATDLAASPEPGELRTLLKTAEITKSHRVLGPSRQQPARLTSDDQQEPSSPRHPNLDGFI